MAFSLSCRRLVEAVLAVVATAAMFSLRQWSRAVVAANVVCAATTTVVCVAK